jgi:hypothetical protein
MIPKPPLWSHRGLDFKKQEKKIHWASMGHETQFNNKFGVKLSLSCPLVFLNIFNQSLLLLCVL